MTLPLLVEKTWPPQATIQNCAPSLRAWGSANQREASLCLKLLTTVCNSRNPGVMVLGESAQPWGRVLWRCRAEQWLFRLLHSSRRRHICEGRGGNPHFRTFLDHELRLNTKDPTPNILLFLWVGLFYKVYIEGQRSGYVGALGYVSGTISIVSLELSPERLLLVSKSWNVWKSKDHISIGPLVHFKVFLHLGILFLDLYESGVCLLTCWLYCGEKNRGKPGANVRNNLWVHW